MKNIDEKVRINKFIASSGYCSRRQADKLVADNKVRINNTPATLGSVVGPSDKVYVDRKLINQIEEKIYLAFNKPRGVTCTTDKRDKTNIIDYINHQQRIFPIGRLDKDSQGLILLTNDGDIVNKILRASNNHEKEYIVTVNKKITPHFLKKMAAGVFILDQVTNPCKIKKINDFTFNIILTQGLNRQIRRMCEVFEYDVITLQRIRIMNIELGKLKLGQTRKLNAQEFNKLEKLLSNSNK